MLSLFFKKTRLVSALLIALIFSTILFFASSFIHSSKYVGIVYLKIGKVYDEYIEKPGDTVGTIILDSSSNLQQKNLLFDVGPLDPSANLNDDNFGTLRIEARGDNPNDIVDFLDYLAFNAIERHKNLSINLSKFNANLYSEFVQYLAKNENSKIILQRHSDLEKISLCSNNKLQNINNSLPKLISSHLTSNRDFSSDFKFNIENLMINETFLGQLLEDCTNQIKIFSTDQLSEKFYHSFVADKTYQTTMSPITVRKIKPSESFIILFYLVFFTSITTAFVLYHFSRKTANE